MDIPSIARSPLAGRRLEQGFLLVIETDVDEEYYLDACPSWVAVAVNSAFIEHVLKVGREHSADETHLSDCPHASCSLDQAGSRGIRSPYEWRLRCSSIGFSLNGANAQSGARIDTALVEFEDLARALAGSEDATEIATGKMGWLGRSLVVSYVGATQLRQLADLLLRTHPETSTSYTEALMRAEIKAPTLAQGDPEPARRRNRQV